MRYSIGAAVPRELPGLYRYARTLCNDPAQAEDLVQETVLRALERADTFRGQASPGTWLHRIMHNLAVDQARARREIPTDDIAAAVEALWREDAWTVDAETVALRAQTRADLEDALIRLPMIYRSTVVLHDAEGLTVRQVASVQSIELPAAKQRLRRGRMMLVTELARGPERRAALKGVPMRCWDARRQVSDYLDGELSTDEAARVERHLAHCPTCPPLYNALVATCDALTAQRPAPGGLRDPDSVVPEQLARRVAELLARRIA